MSRVGSSEGHSSFHAESSICTYEGRARIGTHFDTLFASCLYRKPRRRENSHDRRTQARNPFRRFFCARKLMALDSDRPSPAKVAAVENAISQAAFILEHIDRRYSLPRRLIVSP